MYRASETEKSSLVDIKKGKKARTWGVLHNGNVADAQVLDYSETNEKASVVEEDRKFLEEQVCFIFVFIYNYPDFQGCSKDFIRDFYNKDKFYLL